MKTRREIVENWLPRYTGVPLERFGEYILLTNFQNYVKLFAKLNKVPVMGKDRPMPSATAGDITIINFGMGSATAATVMDLLSALPPKAVLFLGKCGGIKHRAEMGDLILPIAAIRGEGTSNDYFPPDSVRSEFFTPSETHTNCPWKGQASYRNIEVNGERNPDAAWYYPNPFPAASQIKNYVAFWKGVRIER